MALEAEPTTGILWLHLENGEWVIVGENLVTKISRVSAQKDAAARDLWFTIWFSDGGTPTVRTRIRGDAVHSFGYQAVPTEGMHTVINTTFEDAAFVSGSSPATHDIHAVLGRRTQSLRIRNDGPGDLQYELSPDGSTFGSATTLKASDGPDTIDDANVDSVRITWVANTGYRITAL